MLPTYGEKPEYYHTCAHHVCVSILKKEKFICNIMDIKKKNLSAVLYITKQNKTKQNHVY